MNFNDFFWTGSSNFFDFHAPGSRGHDDRTTGGAVVGNAQVNFLVNVGSLVDKHFPHREAFNFHAKDLRGQLFSFFG